MSKHTRNDSIRCGRYYQVLMLVVIVFTFCGCGMNDEKPSFVQKQLGFEEKALEPTISARTMRLHYGQHYAGYIREANKLLKKSRFKGQTMIQVMQATWQKDQYAGIFNNVAQAWNHEFWFESIKPGGGGQPEGALAEKMKLDFGGFDRFKAEFQDAAVSQFGSGWVWLVLEKKRLKILATANAVTPVAQGLVPLFVIDVWEHAYYLDYENRRGAYVEAVITSLANWDMVTLRIKQASAQSE